VMELTCGACGGRFAAEVPGSTVACPHCGTHVQAPSDASSPTPDSDMFEVEDDPSRVAGADKETFIFRPEDWQQAVQQQISAEETFPNHRDPATDTTEIAGGEPGNSETSPLFTVDSSPSLPGDSGSTTTVVGADAAAGNPPLANDLAGGRVATPPAETSFPDLTARGSLSAAAGAQVPRGVSRLVFLVVLSYASAMTLACAYLLYQRQLNPGTLDLPDLVPPVQKSKGKVVKMILPEDHPVPEPNQLRLGESRRFGSVVVTPLRVTRGPLEFAYYKDEDRQERDPDGPVLKLHVRFENVSTDQEFVPLDSVLVFSKDRDPKTRELFRCENFVSRVSDRGRRDKQSYTYDIQPYGVWMIKDQRLDTELHPGESLESFIPTSPDRLDLLEGDLVWRFHFRKGYNPTTYRGVTTLVEVLFQSSEITEESPTPPGDDSTNERNA
jgi:hypothetical protein